MGFGITPDEKTEQAPETETENYSVLSWMHGNPDATTAILIISIIGIYLLLHDLIRAIGD